MKDGTKPATTARCTACETRLVDGQCPMGCSQKEGSRSGVESAGEPECKHCSAGIPRVQLTDGTWAHEFREADPQPENPKHQTAWMEPCDFEPAAGDALLDATIREAAKHHGKPQDVEAWAKKLAEDSVAAGEMEAGDALRDARFAMYLEALAKSYPGKSILLVVAREGYALGDAFARSRTVSLEAQLAERNAMYEGMPERADASRGKLVEALRGWQEFYPDCAQLLDGWHADTAWTDWDTSVRRSLMRHALETAEALGDTKTAEVLRTALEGQ